MALITTQALNVDSRIKDLSFDINQGELIGLIGPNGAGKSTLLNTLAGLEDFSGSIVINDNNFQSYSSNQRARMVGLQPQFATSAWSISVSDVVALGRIPWGDNDEDAIKQAMLNADVNNFADRTIDHLSGGERARVWMARVLAGQPDVLLSDEPVANLDIHYQLSVMDVLKSYAQEGHGVVVALHDLSLAARYCDRLCLMNKGGLVACGTADEVLKESVLSEVYGVEVEVDLHRKPPVVLPK